MREREREERERGGEGESERERKRGERGGKRSSLKFGRENEEWS